MTPAQNQPVQQPIQQNFVQAEETTFLNNQPQMNNTLEETVLLSASTIRPYLTRLSSNGLERIDLLKDQFVIGRQAGIVDYAVQENAIGRMHAEFSISDGQYYVKDLNSTKWNLFKR